MLRESKHSQTYPCQIPDGCEKTTKLAFCEETPSALTLKAKFMKALEIIVDKHCFSVDTKMNARELKEPFQLLSVCTHV